MQPSPPASDLSVRIAEVRAVGAALDDLRLQVAAIGRRGADIAADTRWKSEAMASYERDVHAWLGSIADLAAGLRTARAEVGAVADEMVLTDLVRSAGPGMAVAR